MIPIDSLKSVVGPGGWRTDPDELAPHLREWRNVFVGETPLMLIPDSTLQVAEIMKICSESRTGIVPQGGNTGLCGGALPTAGRNEILLSLSRMNRVRSISADDHTVTAEAGCTLHSVHQAASGAGRFFPLSLSAEGSCQIGGNLSTNAGGVNVLRYGTARDLTLGLEVVLPDGKIWNGLRRLRKDTAGYDLKQLFIGAEGTLGIITAACLRLFPEPIDPITAVLTLDNATAAVPLLSHCRKQLDDQVQAFELIPDVALRFVARHIPDTRFPCLHDAPWYVLMECTGQGSEERLIGALQRALDEGLASNAVIAKNRTEAESWWRARHSISESQKHEGASLKHDISVPVGQIGEFIEAAEAAVLKVDPEVRVVAFGHVGDGNVHFNLSQPAGSRADEFLGRRDHLSSIVYDTVIAFDGSISAEHGIGVAKRDFLLRYKDQTEITLMRAVKSALDPDNLMNPGKVI